MLSLRLCLFAGALLLAGPLSAASYKKLVNAGSGQCLATVVASGGAVSFRQMPYARQPGLHWNFRVADGKSVGLINQATQRALTVVTGTDGKPALAEEAFDGRAEQLWDVTPAGGGQNQIAAKRGGWCLQGLPDGGVGLRVYAGTPAQKWTFAVMIAEVYFGGTHPLPYLADPKNRPAWAWVGAHADGLYTSNVRIHDAYARGSYARLEAIDWEPLKKLMESIGAGMKNRNLFYETDSGLTHDPAWDRRCLETILSAGWGVTHSVLWDTEHRGFPTSYLPALRVGWPARPVHAGVGMWTLGGDFYNRDWKQNGMVQDAMLAFNGGCATEGVGSLYTPEYPDGERNLISLIKWTREKLPAADVESNLSPGEIAPLGFFRQVMRCVRNLEDAGLKPDQWVITYYGPGRGLAMGPDSEPYSYLGVVKWLILHEQDPARYPAVATPYFRDDFSTLAAWDSPGNAQAKGHSLTLKGPADPRTRTISWNPDFQIHITSLRVKRGQVGIVFRDQGRGNFYAWEFGDGTLTLKRYVGGRGQTIKSGIRTGVPAGESASHVIIEVIGSKIHTWLNLREIDVTTDKTYVRPGGVGFHVEAGSEGVAASRMTVY